MTGKPSGETGFGPTASWPLLKFRAELLARLRSFFAQRGFLEVETPLLSADTIVDRYIDPILVQPALHRAANDQPGSLWLQTSPEYGMKRLMAAGGRAIYQVTKAFRDGERGRLHNLEFTMVEWYRAHDGMQEGMQLLDDLVTELLGRGSCERLTYQAAFERYLNIDPHSVSTDELRTASRKCNIAPDQLGNYDRDELLNALLDQFVTPHLGVERPTIIYDYPASQAALARLRDTNPPLAERFELYVDSLELANGYHELLDAEQLRYRIQRTNALRAADGKQRLPESSRLSQAMQHGLPPCSGTALGFDRLVMAAAGADAVDQVITFPIERA